MSYTWATTYHTFNQDTSILVWMDIIHVHPPQFLQRIPYELPLNTLNSIDMHVIKRQPHTICIIRFFKGIRIPELTWQSLHKPQHWQSFTDRNIDLLSKRFSTVHYDPQITDRVNAIKNYFSHGILHIRIHDQLRFAVRYLKDNEPIERFLQYIIIDDHKSASLADVLVNFLKKNNIELQDCPGQSYDTVF
jgi:hypothetical protein